MKYVSNFSLFGSAIGSPVNGIFMSETDDYSGDAFRLPVSQFTGEPGDTVDAALLDVISHNFVGYTELYAGKTEPTYPAMILAFIGIVQTGESSYALGFPNTVYTSDGVNTGLGIPAHIVNYEPTMLPLIFPVIADTKLGLVHLFAQMSNEGSPEYLVNAYSYEDLDIVDIDRNSFFIYSSKARHVYSENSTGQTVIDLDDITIQFNENVPAVNLSRIPVDPSKINVYYPVSDYSADQLVVAYDGTRGSSVRVIIKDYSINEYTFSLYSPKNSVTITIVKDDSNSDPYIPGNSDPYAPGLGPGGSGGGGYFGKNPSTGQPETSDPITIPAGSVAGDASATGMMTRYLANSSQLEIFGDWLWTDDLGLAIAKAGISLLYGSPAEAVISLMSYPFDISSLSGVATRSQNLYWGNHNSGIGATALTSPAATIDWGTISLNEYWGNFLDYEPHTKIELYLPWGTGFVSVDPGQCLPGTLRVVTNIDLNKGSCIHNVFGNNGCVVGTYAGQCSQQIPIISNDYASKIAGVVTAGVSLAIGGVSGIGAGKSAENARLDYDMNVPLPAMNNMRAMQNYYMGMEEYVSAVSKSTNRGRTASNLASIGSVAAARHSGIVARNGSFTDGSASLGCQYPYIILSRPSQSVPKEYGSHYGYPSNIYTQLSNLRGYTEVGEIHLNGIDATEPEIVELDRILKGGVIF